MKTILVIDGQGGRVGALLVSEIKKADLPVHLIAVGTNTIATSAMLKAGADQGATGENPVVVGSRRADIIIGPIGIVLADALLGEVTAAMAAAVASSEAQRILIPQNRCSTTVVGTADRTVADYVVLAMEKIRELVEE